MSDTEQPRHRDERGAVIVFMSLMLVAIFAVAALVVDLGNARQVRRQGQAAADASALAGAYEIMSAADATSASSATSGRTAAIAKIRAYALRNFAVQSSDWVGCVDSAHLTHTDSSSNNQCISFGPAAGTPSRVRVRVRLPQRIVPGIVGSAVGKDALSVGVAAEAEAVVPVAATSAVATNPGANTAQCGLCVQGTLQTSGNTFMQVTGGGTIDANNITINSQNGTASITPLPIYYHGSTASNWACTTAPCYSRVGGTVPNPYSSTAVPTAGVTVDTGSYNNPTTLTPNRVYYQSVTLNAGTMTLSPGVYYFANNLNITGSANLVATGGVTLVFGCATSTMLVAGCGAGSQGTFNFGTTGNITVTAPTNGPTAGFAILFDPGNTTNTAPQFTSSSTAATYTFNGAVYGRLAQIANNGSNKLYTQSIVIGGWVDNAGPHQTYITHNAASTTMPSCGVVCVLSTDSATPGLDLSTPTGGGTPILTVYSRGSRVASAGRLRANGGRVENLALSYNGNNFPAGPTMRGSATVDPCTSCNPSVTQGTPFTDPYTALPTPTSYAVTGAIASGQNRTGGGVLTGNMTGGNVTLSDGVYVLTGTLDFRNGGGLVTSNATVYFACGGTTPRACNSGGESGGTILMGATGCNRLFGPAPDGNIWDGRTTWNGIAVMYDRNNTATFGFGGQSCSPVWNGYASIQFRGTLYGASATFEMQGPNGNANIDSIIVFRRLVNNMNDPTQNQRGTGHIYDYVTPGYNAGVPTTGSGSGSGSGSGGSVGSIHLVN